MFQTIVCISFYRKYIINNWGQYKCQPYIMPIAGLFGHDTSKNFQECLFMNTNINSNIAINPMYNISGLMGDVLGDMSGTINSLRGGLFEVRGFFESILGNFIGKIENLMTSMQILFIKTRSLIEKLLGIFTTLIYTLFTTIATMNSMIGGPIGSLAGVGGCFHPETEIIIENGIENQNNLLNIIKTKQIKDLKINSKIKNGIVIATMIFKNNNPLYNVSNNKVSAYHYTYHNHKWDLVKNISEQLKENNNINNNIFCLINSTNRIITNNNLNKQNIFSDYLGCSNNFINNYIKKSILNFLNNKPYIKTNFINENLNNIKNSNNDYYYVHGFHPDEIIPLLNNKKKKIKHIQIGDILYDNQEVLGIIHMKNISQKLYNFNNIFVSGKQIIYYENKYTLIENIPNLNIIEYKKDIYNITTNNGFIHINNYKFVDYFESNDDELFNYIDKILLEYLNITI
jgi:hypothetical protein